MSWKMVKNYDKMYVDNKVQYMVSEVLGCSFEHIYKLIYYWQILMIIRFVRIKYISIRSKTGRCFVKDPA